MWESEVDESSLLLCSIVSFVIVGVKGSNVGLKWYSVDVESKLLFITQFKLECI